MRLVLALCALCLHAAITLSLLSPTSAQAIDRSQCKQDGGTTDCWEPVIGPWTYGVCGEVGAFNDYNIAECSARGGTWNGSNCLNPVRPTTEGDLVPLAQDIYNAYRGPFCEGPSGGPLTWGMVFFSNNCFSGAGAGFTQGYYSSDSSTFPVIGKRIVAGVCQTTDSTLQFDARKQRTVACPGGDESYVQTSGATPGLCSLSFRYPGNPKTNPGPCPDGKCGNPMVVGNPINPMTGVKTVNEVDYVGPGPQPLRFARTFNNRIYGVDGKKWRHTYMARIVDQATLGTVPMAIAHRPNGQTFLFTLTGGQYLPDADIDDRLTRLVDGGGNLTGWQYYQAASESVEAYDAEGKLVSITNRAGLTQTLEYSTAATPPSVASTPGLLIRVTDAFGRQLNFTYDVKDRLSTMQDPEGQTYTYEQSNDPNSPNLIASVTYPAPGNKQRKYLYNEPAPLSTVNKYGGLLTGIIDENNSRFASYSYDGFGMAFKSEHGSTGSGIERASVDYNTFTGGAWINPINVTDARGTVRGYNFAVVNGVRLITSITQPAVAGGTATTFMTYDANGNIASRRDWNGNRTNYTFDLARNLETQRVEGLTSAGATTPQTRTISTQWDTNFRLPSAIAEPLRITTMVYDATGATCGAKGALCSKSIQATTDANGSQGFSATPSGSPRAWSYTYNANGNVLTINGPRTDVADVTTYTYYANNDPTINNRGMLQSVSNALGHLTQVTSYNAHGQPLTIIDPNGLTTTMTYDERQRLKTRTVGTELTSYDYDGVGQLTKVTLPDGSFLSYGYDAAHRLTSMTDNLGNSVTYTLDVTGNRTQEQVKDPANTLLQTRSRVYNNLNRLFQELGALNQTTEYTYDNQGNVLTVKDPNNNITTSQYDPLNRLKQVTAPAPVSAVTQYAYNGLDALTQVTDPRNLVTGYTVDGLGNLTQQASPDTGSTASTYDDAGNLLTQTDAKSQQTTYTYDALNRVALISFHDGSNQQYVYDTAANGIGRLATITEKDPANVVTSVVAYAYDQHGRVTSETRTVAGVQYVLGYSYDSFGRLSGLTYPSTRTVTYGFDSLGRVNQVSTTANSVTQVIVQGVEYHPFGGVKLYTLGNQQITSRTIDLDGRIAAYNLGNTSYSIAYDAANRITGIGANTYGYDNLDRLTSAVLASSNYGYGYDGVGNRLSKTTGASSETYTYSPTSNRIATVGTRSFVFDPNGSTTDDALNTYVYDTRGRMVQATSTVGATSYQVNALGQRIRKTNTSGDTVFHYDTRGRLIAETDPGGAVKRELFYLGDIPVGVFQ
jgi:YD repeat-containing protein